MATSTETKIIEIKVPIGEGIKQIQLLTNEIERLRLGQAALKNGSEAEKLQYEKNAIAIKEYTRQKTVLQREVQNEIKTSQSAMGAYQKLQTEYTKATQKAKDLAAANTATSKEIKKAADEANKLGDRLKKADASIGQHQRNVGNYSSAVAGLGSQLRNFVGIGAIIAGIGAAFRNAFGIVKAFDQAMANVNAITNATKDELKQLRDIAISLGGSTKFTASEVAGLETELGKLGFTTQQIIAATKGITLAAAATGESLEKTAMIVGSTTMAFGLNASETQRVADVMAKSFSTSALDLENFSDSIKYVAPIAKQAGVSVEETAALLGILANNGIKGSMAGTSLRKVFTDLIGTGGNLQEKIAELTKGGLNLADAKDEVGRTAMTTLMILKDNIKTIPELTKVYQGAAGAAQDMADKQLNTIQGRITILKSTWEGFILSVENGQGRFSTAIKNMIVGLTGAVAGLRKLLMTDNERSLDEMNNITASRITEFEKWMSQAKDKVKYIDQEIIAEKNLNKQRTQQIIDLDAQINKNKELGGAWAEQNESLKQQRTNIKETINSSNSYINALGGIKKAKKDESALAINVASIVDENTKQNTETLKNELNKRIEDIKYYTQVSIEELEKLDASIVKEFTKAQEIQYKSLGKDVTGQFGSQTDVDVKAEQDAFNNRKQNYANFLSDKLDIANGNADLELDAQIDILNLRNNQELAAKELTEEQKIAIDKKYEKKREQLEVDTTAKKLNNTIQYASAVAGIMEGAFAFTNALAQSELSLWAKQNKGKANFDEEYAKKKAEIDHKQAVRNKVMQVINSLINGASAVVSLLHTPPLAVAAGIAAALQTAAIIATPIPDKDATSYSGGSSLSQPPDLTSKMASPLTNSVNAMQATGGSNVITSGAANSSKAPSFDYNAMANIMSKMPAPELSIVELRTKEKQVDFIDNVSTIKS